MPSTKGKFSGLSVRVPTPVVSLIDLVFVANKKTTKEEINKIFHVFFKIFRFFLFIHLKGIARKCKNE